MIKRNLIFILVSCWAFHATAQTGREKEVMDKMENLNNAIFVNKDSVALAGMLDEKLSYAHSDGHIENKAEMIKNAVHNLTTYRNVGMEKTSVVFFNNTAIARQQLNALQTDNTGKESPLHLGILQVWIQEGKQWKLVARESVKLAVN